MKTIIHPTEVLPPPGDKAMMADALPRAWVLYDADCPMCTRAARRFENFLARRGFALLPLQTPWVRERLNLPETELLAEMRLLFPDGKIFSGAAALVELCRYYWWAWPLFALGHLPPFRALLHAGYRWLARNRTCNGNACAINTKKTKAALTLIDFLPLMLLPTLALLFKAHLAPWVFMWTMAFAIFTGCKWLTYRQVAKRDGSVSVPRAIGYLFAWPGMDATKFLDAKCVPDKPRHAEWLFALAKTFFGITLLWGVARTALPEYPLLAGWIGMAGIIFTLHFGLFHVLSLLWRRLGVAAAPIMDRPLLATSLAEFWSKRWNTAFNALAFQFTFRPLRRATNAIAATLLVFLVSGAVHELVISLPAKGGYGLPTIYFLIQGLGMVLEHPKPGHGVRGRLFTIMVVTAPAFWLFPPPFIKTVILPMLHAIGAT